MIQSTRDFKCNVILLALTAVGAVLMINFLLNIASKMYNYVSF